MYFAIRFNLCYAAPILATLALAAGLVPHTQSPMRPTSPVPGKAFDRIVFIWLENTDYDMAIGDRMSSRIRAYSGFGVRKLTHFDS